MTAKAFHNVALIVAAGRGTRVDGDIAKQFLPLRGKAMLRHSFESFASHNAIDGIYIAIADGQQPLASEALAGLPSPTYVTGGASRRESVLAGLQAIAQDGGAQNILIHDAARPFLSHDIIDSLLNALRDNAAAVPALPVVDSLARGDTHMGDTVARDELRRIQTPQAFRFDAIYAAHMAWDSSKEATDDARIAQRAGHEVAIIPGEEALAKFTFAEDFSAENANDGEAGVTSVRSGTGYDVHRLAAGEELWLCGVKLDHDRGLAGHSDADVAIHALVDAILGALALGDIGDHFPPSNPKWKGASSDRFLAHAMKLAREAGYRLSNADITIICEAPKIGPHRQKMRERLAEIMDVQPEVISVKATTSERLGFTGREEGIAAQAIATLIC